MSFQNTSHATRHMSLAVILIVLIFGRLLCADVPTASDSPHPADPWKLGIGGKSRPKNARTIIDAEEGAWFDDLTNTIEFNGRVVVHDPQFILFCDQLHVVMNKNRQGLQQVIATGNVIIEQENTNDQGEVIKYVAEAKPYKQTQQPKLIENPDRKQRVKLDFEMKEYSKNMDKWKFCMAWCKEQGINFQIITEKTFEKKKK